MKRTRLIMRRSQRNAIGHDLRCARMRSLILGLVAIRWSVVSLFLTNLFFCAVVLVGVSSVVAAPRLDILNPVFEFDTIPQGEQLEHKYILRNVGDEELEIQRIIPACGCTVPELKESRIQPGAETVLSVQLDTRGMYGRKEKTVRLYTNDPQLPTALLTLRGEIEPEVLVEPYRLDFGDVIHSTDPEDGIEQGVTIRIRDGLRARIGELSTRSKWLEITEKSRVKNRIVEASVRLKSEVPIGEFRDRVVIRVTGAQQRTVNLPVYASIQKQIEVEPPVVAFGVLPATGSVQREVKISNRGKKPLKILSITSNHSDMSAFSEVVKAGREFRGIVRYIPSKRDTDIKTTVTIVLGNLMGEPVDEVVLSVTGVAALAKNE